MLIQGQPFEMASFYIHNIYFLVQPPGAHDMLQTQYNVFAPYYHLPPYLFGYFQDSQFASSFDRHPDLPRK
jgi:hypothetical protein